MPLFEMCMAAGRLDWWSFARERTPFELQLLMAQWSMSPQGQERADQRAALNTLALVAAVAMETPQPDRLDEVLSTLTAYTPQERELKAAEIASPQQAAATLRGSMGGRRG